MAGVANRTIWIIALGLCPAAQPAGAWEFRTRFIERVGNNDTVLEGGVIDASSLTPRRIRIQFGVFDDANGDAPAGGFAGWRHGAISVGGPIGNSDHSRTPGRLGGFGRPSPIPPNGNGTPEGDPFTALTEIEAYRSAQSPYWGFGEPMPAPTIAGLNAYLSIYEITINPHPGAVSYEITYAGNLVAATEWVIAGEPMPPAPPDVPGSVVYTPVLTSPVPFTARLQVVIPSAPGAAAVAGLCVYLAGARRRR